MDVFLVPVGVDRYELYCEVGDEPDESPDEPHTGFVRGLKHRFGTMLAEAERERRHGRVEHPSDGWWGRAKSRIMRWVAESIAEQRLLWTMRRQTAAALHFPSDLPETRAVELMRTQLGRDFDKHQFWLIIDTLGFIASGLLMLIPGPNLLAYYFAFRLVGHYFSLRGAKCGLRDIAWTNHPSVPLAELRRAINMDPADRERRVNDIATALGLEHLAKFFHRSAIPTI